jgi:F-type H+-transporting ATPase subunit b
MQRGWLLLGLGVLLLTLCAAPVRAETADEPGGEAKPHDAAKPEDAGHKAAEEAIKHEESDIFKGFLDLSIWSIVVFVILFTVLRVFAWKPMLEGLKHREDNIHGALESAQKANAEAQALKAEFERKMSEAQQQARAVVEEARKNAERLAEEIKSKANADAAVERDRVRRELELEKETARVEIFQRGALLASLMSSKALRRQMTIDDQHRLVEEALNDLGVAVNERQRVLASVT